jgi:hypothetical protein
MVALTLRLIVQYHLPITVAVSPKGMDCLHPLNYWDRGFEAQSSHGYLCAFILCLCYPVCR